MALQLDDGDLVLRGSDATVVFVPSVEELSQAKELDLCGNLLRCLPSEIFADGNKWKQISMCRNQLEALPESLGLIECKKLHLQNNRLCAIPKLPAGLQLLDVGSNVLGGGHDLEGAVDLVTLRIQNNALTRLRLVDAVNLASVDVSRNDLAELPELRSNNRLSKILAAHNSNCSKIRFASLV